MTEMMSTKEVARYLRVKERKIYELVRAGRIPCTRATGKYLFPRNLIDLWLAESVEFPGGRRAGGLAPPPPVVAGSHDPLLDWALREAGTGLALLAAGSLDGVRRLAAGEAAVAGVHVRDPETGVYNLPLIEAQLAGLDVVAIRWAGREQGLVTAPGNPRGIRGIEDLRGRRVRVLPRQGDAGSQILFQHLLSEVGIGPEEVELVETPALSESDLGLAIAEGKADAGPAIRAVAHQYGLGFVPLARERYDLVMRRREYFEPPMQKLLAFARGAAFRRRAEEMTGYDVSDLGEVVYNAP